jgi:hypothetical protein
MKESLEYAELEVVQDVLQEPHDIRNKFDASRKRNTNASKHLLEVKI